MTASKQNDDVMVVMSKMEHKFRKHWDNAGIRLPAILKGYQHGVNIERVRDA